MNYEQINKAESKMLYEQNGRVPRKMLFYPVKAQRNELLSEPSNEAVVFVEGTV